MSDKHNQAILPLLTALVEAAPKEESQWVLLETLCLGIGKLHGRNPRDIAAFIETMAERIATGERASGERPKPPAP